MDWNRTTWSSSARQGETREQKQISGSPFQLDYISAGLQSKCVINRTDVQWGTGPRGSAVENLHPNKSPFSFFYGTDQYKSGDDSYSIIKLEIRGVVNTVLQCQNNLSIIQYHHQDISQKSFCTFGKYSTLKIDISFCFVFFFLQYVFVFLFFSFLPSVVLNKNIYLDIFINSNINIGCSLDSRVWV